MAAARGLYRVHRDLYVTICSIFDPHRHRQTRCQLSMYLALRRARSDRTPADEVGIELAKRGIEKLGPGRHSYLQNIGEQLPGESQPFINMIGLIQVRIVDESLPADDCSRFFEVDPHDNQKRI